MNNQAFDPRKDVVERLAFARQLFGADIHAMSSDDLAATCGGQSRCGYDFIFEMVGFFDTFGGLLKNGPSDIEGPQGGWVRAPKEFCDKASAVAAMNASADNFTEAILAYTGDFVADVFPSPVGPFTPLGMANLAVWHTMYHSGQLNYIQTVRGDVAFNWIPGDN
ncbi:MAG: hypothetical protein JNJ45_05000 [Chthonomonas sp.]|nr:hypothetical protein [Chthonomonas sp.]